MKRGGAKAAREGIMAVYAPGDAVVGYDIVAPRSATLRIQIQTPSTWHRKVLLAPARRGKCMLTHLTSLTRG
jgi:hypothetical protein